MLFGMATTVEFDMLAICFLGYKQPVGLKLAPIC